LQRLQLARYRRLSGSSIVVRTRIRRPLPRIQRQERPDLLGGAVLRTQGAPVAIEEVKARLGAGSVVARAGEPRLGFGDGGAKGG
jgi:hypothetical protein